jgi:hypothetical protein
VVDLEFFDDPRAFLEVAGEHLAAHLRAAVVALPPADAGRGGRRARGEIYEALGCRPVIDMANLVIR